MGNESINAHLDVGKTNIEVVWYSSNAALGEGEAVCYNWDYGTATTAEASRRNRVETPTTLNAQHFAGVSEGAYSAVSGGQFIRIYTPGSVCKVLCGKDTNTVIGVSLLTFEVTSGFLGEFRYEGLPGRGSAVPLQTTTGDASNPGLCLARLLDGPESGGVEVVAIVDNDAIGTLMIGGTTLVTGATIGSGDCTYTLADGTVDGIFKKFKVITTEIATNDLVVTVTSGATDDVDDVSLDTVTWAGSSTVVNKSCTLKWGGAWMIDGKTEDVPVLGGS